MISADNLSKAYGPQTIFDQITFKLNHKERVGLVGRNGHGKTTLFRLIMNEEEADNGQILTPKLYRIDCVSQVLKFTTHTVIDEVAQVLPAEDKNNLWKAEKVLFGLGFTEDDLQTPPAQFSGGFQVRLNLAKALISSPDLLLLDEPTNYLDITSIIWLEQFLSTWPRELMLITHNRGFMDKVVTHTLAIHRCKVKKIVGNTEKLYAQIAQEEEIYEKTRINDEKKKKEIEQFINRFRAKARLANMVQSRIKTIEKMEKKEKLENVQSLDFAFRYNEFPAKNILEVSDLSFEYEKNNSLFNDLGFIIGARDRICIIGKNGKGKTTLLKLLAEKFQPDKGSILYHPKAIKGYFEQTNTKILNDNNTVLDEVMITDQTLNLQAARNVCGAMMFEGDLALKKISVLSGGEKSRVMLGKILAQPLNILLLDEVTNHLDMESCDALIAALDHFPGAIIMVTHNEMFLHALAQRLIVFKNNNAFIFNGTYQDFLEKEGWEDTVKTEPVPENSDSSTKLNKKELRRQRSAKMAARAKEIKPLKKKISSNEALIEKLEQDLALHTQDMQTASEAQDGPKIQELGQAIHACQTKIDGVYEELEELYQSLENKEKEIALGDGIT